MLKIKKNEQNLEKALELYIRFLIQRNADYLEKACIKLLSVLKKEVLARHKKIAKKYEHFVHLVHDKEPKIRHAYLTLSTKFYQTPSSLFEFMEVYNDVFKKVIRYFNSPLKLPTKKRIERLQNEFILKQCHKSSTKFKDDLSLHSNKSEFELSDFIGKKIIEARKIKNPKNNDNPQTFDVLFFCDGTFLLVKIWSGFLDSHHQYYYFNGEKTLFSHDLFSSGFEPLDNPVIKIQTEKLTTRHKKISKKRMIENIKRYLSKPRRILYANRVYIEWQMIHKVLSTLAKNDLITVKNAIHKIQVNPKNGDFLDSYKNIFIYSQMFEQFTIFYTVEKLKDVTIGVPPNHQLNEEHIKVCTIHLNPKKKISEKEKETIWKIFREGYFLDWEMIKKDF